MQPKLIAAILVLMVVSLVVAGCTNSTTPTATPKSRAAKVAYLESYLSSQGYTTAISNTVFSPNNEGYPMYHGNAYKGGMDYTVSVTEADSQSGAMREFNRDLNWSVRFGFVGNYINATSWQGSMTDKGTLYTHALLVIDDKWVVSMFAD